MARELLGGLAFEALITELSSRFIHLSPEDLDAAIEDGLRRVCEPLGLDLAVLWQWSDAAPGVIRPTHAYVAGGLPRPSEPMAQAEYPWSVAEVLAGRTIRMSAPDRLPPEAAVDRETCRRYGIRAALCLPLAVGGQAGAVGALGFNDLRGEREWPDAVVKRLELVAEILTNALARRRHELKLRESEERLALAADAAGAGVWRLEFDSGLFWTTGRARTLFEYAPDEVITVDRLRAWVHPDDWDVVRGAIDRSAREGAPVDVEYRIVPPGGGERWISSRGRALPDPGGGYRFLTGLSVDVTERKRAEREARERLEFETLIAELSARFVNLPAGDVDREIEDALRRVCEPLGIELAVLWQWSTAAPQVIAPTHLYSLQEGLRLDALSQEQYPWYRREMLAGHECVVPSLDRMPEEAAVDRESCRLVGVKSNLSLPLVAGGEPVGALGFNTLGAERDWPETLVNRLRAVGRVFSSALARQRADQALRESEEVNRATFEQAAVGIAHVGTDGRFLRVNDKLCAVVGFSREELLARTFQDITHPEDLEEDLGLVRRVLAGEIGTYSMEKRYRRRDGSAVWANLTVSLVRGAAGEPRHFISVVEDITERKAAEEALRFGRDRLEAAADLAGLGFYEVNLRERTTASDDRFDDICGIPPESRPGLGLLEFWREHLHPDDGPRLLELRQQLHAGRLERLSDEYRYLHPTRGERWLHHLARVSRHDAFGNTTFGVVRDITERRRREEALEESLAEIRRLKDRLQAESDYLKAEIRVAQPHLITGQSPAIQGVLRQVEQVAPTGSSVLIRGETGCGKELVAQSIHRLSPRASHVMVKVNCAALPSGLVESELFGREKGAFTGALTRQVGRFEVADGSTLFLDEVGELSLEVQAKLLRVLETGEFERLGNPKTLKVDVRLVAATNRDLAEDVRRGRFREDLFYRLNVFPIRVPPLRERAEDIPQLVWTFLEEFSSRMGKRITQVPRRTMEALQRQPWPGNVRELRNVIEHAAILTTGDTLRVPHLEDAAPVVAAAQPTLAESERELILRALERTRWRVKGPKGAAAALGLNPSTLYSRMKKLGIRPPGEVEGGSA